MAWRYVVAVGATVLTYLVTRLFALTSLPPFVDEALHIQWAHDTWDGALGAGAWYGKFLSIKLMALFVMLPIDPLAAGRLAAVTSGLGTMVACLKIGQALFSLRAGIIASCVYALMPLAFFHERMALTDSVQSCFTAWTLFFSIEAARSPSRFDLAKLGSVMSAAVLAKLTAVPVVVFPCLAVVFLGGRNRRQTLRRVAPASILPVALALVLFWRFEDMVPSQAVDVTRSTAATVTVWVTNLRTLGYWSASFLTIPGIVLGMTAATWLAVVQGRPEARLLVAVAGATIGPLVFFSTTWFSRYLTFSAVPLSLLIAEFLCTAADNLRYASGLRRRLATVPVLLGALYVVAAARLDWNIISAPYTAAIPAEDRRQYLTDWSSGYGVSHAAEYLTAASVEQASGINVVRYHYWDHPLLGLNLYLNPSDRLHVHTLDAGRPDVAAEVGALAESRPTFLVLNLANTGNAQPLPWSVMTTIRGEMVWTAPRPGTGLGLSIWRVRPSSMLEVADHREPARQP